MSMEEKSTDSVQSVEIPSDMYNLLQNGQAMNVPMAVEQEFDNSDLMQLTVMKGLQEQDMKPHLKILEQPKQRGFRFRYGCEGPSHGGLPGTNSQRGKRSFPSVEICNYRGPARIVVSLVTNEETPRPHAHSLVGKHCRDGLCTVQVGPKDMTASFPNLGILHVTRKDVVPTLKRRILDQHRLYKSLISDPNADGNSHIVDPSDAEVEKKAKDMAKDMDLSVVRLCFQTYLTDSNGHFTQPVDPVISVPVYDSKAPNATTLKICRMDKSAGCCTGGEEVYLLCDKVQKEDITVKFFELSADGHITWQDYAEFGPTDVHRQYAIVFKTPTYKDINIDRPVYVHVQLKRKSDNETSDPKPFTYHPQVPDREGILRKRKKHLAHFNEYSSSYQGTHGSGGGMASGGGSGSFQFSSNTNMGFGGNTFNFGGSQISTAPGSQVAPQPAQQLPNQSMATAPCSNSSQQVVFTTAANRLPLPSIETLTSQQRQQRFQPQQFQQQQQQQQQLQLQQQQQQVLPQLNFQMPMGVSLPGGAIGGNTGSQIKMESDNNNKQQYCTMEPVPLHLSSDVRRDGMGTDEANTGMSNLISKGSQWSKGMMEKNIQTDEISIDIDSMAWHVAQVTANALHDYAATGDIKTILTVQRHLIAVEDDFGDTPLHAAVINKKYDVMHSLLSAVIKIPDQTIVNQVNHLKQTALHLAVVTKQSKMVEVLLRCGADPNICDRDGNTPLHLATKNGMNDGVTFLVCGPKAKAAITPPKANLNARNYAGLAPVHLAVLAKNLDVVKILGTAGADINLADGKTGRSPLHYAVEVENFTILGYLLMEAEADVQSVTFSGDTSLHLASSLDLRAIAALLLAAGADPKRENCDLLSEGDSDNSGSDGEDEGTFVKEKGEPLEEAKRKEKHGKTPYQLARSNKMKEILKGKSSVLSQSVDGQRLDSLEMSSTASSIGSLCNEMLKTQWNSDTGYFSEKSSAKELSGTGWFKGYRTVGSSHMIVKGDIDDLSESTLLQLANKLDNSFPVAQSWFALANRLGLSNMLRFLKQVPSPTKVILKQFQAMGGTVEELRAVLLSMEHRDAVALLDKSLSSIEIKDEDDSMCLTVRQSLKELNLSDRNQYQQAIY